jgi:hypothetical protein
MTTIAQALRTVSVGLAELAEALEGSDLPPLNLGQQVAVQSHLPADLEAQANRNAVLGECPVHQTAWVLKEGGVSGKTGKPYKAFWKCDEKNADGTWCQKKPALEWVRTHDPEQVPF